jgi:DNA-binding transcriptional LysR family regulator
VSTTHPLAQQDAIDVADLRGQTWITGSTAGEMGVWPGLDERPEIAHTARDWFAKLRLVAAGCGVTTVAASLAAVAPPGVRILTVRDSSEMRRIILARLPHTLTEPAARLADALRAAASQEAAAASS